MLDKLTFFSLVHRVERHEGFSAKPYQDTEGHWTVGFGHKMSNDIPRHICEALLMHDLDVCQRQAQAIFSTEYTALTPARQSVIVEMLFQLGAEGVEKFTKFAAAIREHDFDLAANEMLDSKWAEQTPGRCQELAAIMRGGVNDGEETGTETGSTETRSIAPDR